MYLYIGEKQKAMYPTKRPHSVTANYILDYKSYKMAKYEVTISLLSSAARGTLLPPPETVRGKTLVMIRVDKIGLKEAAQYIDPFLTVSVKGRVGGCPVYRPLPHSLCQR